MLVIANLTSGKLHTWHHLAEEMLKTQCTVPASVSKTLPEFPLQNITFVCYAQEKVVNLHILCLYNCSSRVSIIHL